MHLKITPGRRRTRVTLPTVETVATGDQVNNPTTQGGTTGNVPTNGNPTGGVAHGSTTENPRASTGNIEGLQRLTFLK